jgi:hypothetical protein
MSLDQMFSMLRSWGEEHTAFGQTARVQRAAAKRSARAQGRKADPPSSPGRAVTAVLESQIERGIVPAVPSKQSLPSAPRSRRTPNSGDHLR